ncbi:MAG: NAD-dependent epimerase/dehydratase family protein [Deltaproteobacteria bacterium]|nr:MAG: NAD-dependent epimerase/dehydratase family protein [Deltaproteobacteria bacterium]
MRILVTGGAGFIGSHICDAYVEAGHEVLVVDDLSSGHRENVPAAAEFVEADVRSGEAARAVRDFAPEVINHHAAQINVRVSVERPRFDAEVNVLGLINVLEAAREAGTRRVIFASSGGTVYGEPDAYPCPETAPTRPICPYGASKLSGEHYLYYYDRIFGLHHIALRYANVYGPRQDPHGEAGVVAIFSQNLLRGDGVTIFGDGLQTRDYVFVGDVVRANVLALTTDYHGPLNIGTAIETNVVELYERIKALAGGPGVATHGPAKEGEVRRSSLDPTRAGERLGWRPEVDLERGLAATVDFFRPRS